MANGAKSLQNVSERGPFFPNFIKRDFRLDPRHADKTDIWKQYTAMFDACLRQTENRAMSKALTYY